MRTQRLGMLFLAVIGVAATSVSQTVTINFDTDTAGHAVPNGAVVDTLYSPWGVTFSPVGSGGCSLGLHVFANADQPSGFGSPPNVVSLCGGGYSSDIDQNGIGLIKASFTTDANQVCIDVRPDGSSDNAVINAYDVAASPIGSATSTAGATQTLCVSAVGIRSVQFSGDGSHFCRFDNLKVDFVEAIPLLSWPALMLLAVGLCAAAIWLLRKLV